MKIKLGGNIFIDLIKLVVSRLLIQANSGGGKSWAIRRIIELAFPHIQIIVIDPEGEFANLRSKFDFVYAGKDGDAPVESRSAALLAHRLLELKASAIIDLYELPPQERKHYVRLFCEALVNAPKELWQDVLVFIDEAHVFAPEKGESEALGAVIDLCSRGRKRGYCAVLATQRPAKLSKDAAAECNNKLIGRASLDIDRKRAAEELGFTTRDEVLSLRDLEPGDFYVFGPAISRNVERVTIGDVMVKPAKRGVSKQRVPAPSGKVRHILKQLSDLPQEAAKEAQTVSELKAQIVQLKRNPVQVTPKADIPMGVSQWRSYGVKYGYWDFFEKETRKEFLAFKNYVFTRIEKVRAMVQEIGGEARKEATEKVIGQVFGKLPTRPKAVTPVSPKLPVVSAIKSASPNSSDQEFNLSGPEQRILDAIALSESIGVQEPEQTAVAFLAGYTFGGGGFNNPRGALKTKSLLEYRGSKIALTEAGRAFANKPETPLTGEMLRNRVLEILPGPEKKLLTPLYEAYPEAMSNSELQTASGYAEGGGFNNPKGRLKTLGLIDYPSKGYARAKDFLFP